MEKELKLIKMNKLNNSKRTVFAILFFLGSFLSFYSCDKDDGGTATVAPKILSIEADTMVIPVGGSKPAILTCNASGDQLTYNWEVDFGDLIPQKSDASVVSFTGSACCVGEKIIKCTVTNSMGSDSETITITIVE